MSDLLRFLVGETGLREYDLKRLIYSAPRRYKIYSIPKRSGARREIAQPTPEIKFLQRAFVRQYLEHLPVHDSATAYRRGMSTRDNAAPHAVNGPLLKMDLRNFFPSIRGRDWLRFCSEKGVLDANDAKLSELLLFFRPPGGRLLRLSVGAPSSPILSNVIMYDFDILIHEAVSKDQVTYTRYADDLTFSAKRTGYLVNVRRDVARVIRGLNYPKLDINGDKTTYATKKYHRSVTGLTLSNDGRVTLGRDRKRSISASVHHALLGKLSPEDLGKLSGMLSYAHSVEPEFVRSLGEKYGAEAVEIIRRFGSSS